MPQCGALTHNPEIESDAVPTEAARHPRGVNLDWAVRESLSGQVKPELDYESCRVFYAIQKCLNSLLKALGKYFIF